MRLLMQRFAAIRINDTGIGVFLVKSLDLGRNVKETLGSQENPSFGRRMPFATRRYSCRLECDVRVSNRKYSVLPTALKPHATAMASSKVDLPEPFSPTKKVNRGCKGRTSSPRTADSENGYASNDGTWSRFRRTSNAYWIEIIVAQLAIEPSGVRRGCWEPARWFCTALDTASLVRCLVHCHYYSHVGPWRT
jgi:hypothetical protein